MAAVVEDGREALVVTVEGMRRQRYYIRLVVLFAYLVETVMMLAAWRHTRFRAPLPPFFLLMTTVVVAPMWLRARASFQRFTLSATGLLLESTVWPRRPKQFSLESLRTARWAPSLLAPLLDPRGMVLDVGGRARRFGANLDEAEARRIVALFEERLQRLRRGPYR